MISQFFLIIFLYLFSITRASHFLGGSFTYRHIPQPIDSKLYKSILVEIRFHISDHYFICTPEQVNQHMIVYLIGETVPYDGPNNRYLWYETEAIRRNRYYYKIECLSEQSNSTCEQFREETWAYCESANQNSGYSILRRQFVLIVERFKPVQLRYSACCWANSSDKNFYFDLFVETKLSRINSSPYPHIPASYYVDFHKPRKIKIFVFDADDDEIICERFEDDLGGFLTVHIDNACTLIYKINRLGKQFGQFWLMDRSQNQILSRSLISIQVHVLKDIMCNSQPELIVKNLDDYSKNMSIIKIKESIYISVSLNPNCLLIEPQDQTITELTTLCTNNQPIVLANGGIEVIFQCTPNLCEKYQTCFVGEFGLKLPSTKTQCFSIEVIGTEDECALAASNDDFLKPRNRQFIIAEPITQKQLAIKSSTLLISSASILLKTRTTLPLRKSTTSLPSESQSRSWLWIFVTFISFLLAGFIGYFGFKKILLIFYQRSLTGDKLHSLSRSSSDTTIESNMIMEDPDTKRISSSIASQDHYDSTPASPQRVKARGQHLRLGPFDEDDL